MSVSQKTYDNYGVTSVYVGMPDTAALFSSFIHFLLSACVVIAEIHPLLKAVKGVPVD